MTELIAIAVTILLLCIIVALRAVAIYQLKQLELRVKRLERVLGRSTGRGPE